jgi:predicted nuclease of restriction endonuclease-like (RecB) superfamily
MKVEPSVEAPLVTKKFVQECTLPFMIVKIRNRIDIDKTNFFIKIQIVNNKTKIVILHLKE